MYKPRWHLGEDKRVVTITGILKEFGNAVIVDLYGDLSDWIHWNAKGIGGGLKRDGNVVRVNWTTNHWAHWLWQQAFKLYSKVLKSLTSTWPSAIRPN